jgi:hypothetical protein
VVVDSVGALLLISDDAERLAAFYRDSLGLSFEEEMHEGVPLHYECEISGMHFAIHLRRAGRETRRQMRKVLCSCSTHVTSSRPPYEDRRSVASWRLAENPLAPLWGTIVWWSALRPFSSAR